VRSYIEEVDLHQFKVFFGSLSLGIQIAVFIFSFIWVFIFTFVDIRVKDVERNGLYLYVYMCSLTYLLDYTVEVQSYELAV